MRIKEIRELYGYNRWATERILEAASSLSEEQFRRDMGSSYASVRDTLVHILTAEWAWLSRWQGVSPTAVPEQWQQLGLDELRDSWAQLDRALQEFVGGLAESDLDEPMSYRTIAGDARVSTLAQMLRHVVNHSSYHRGQVITMLRQHGAVAPATDLILYHWLHTAPQAPA